jgi:hypothetical protein
MNWNHQHAADSKHGRVYLIVVHIAFAVGMAGLLALLFGCLVMLLWNAVMPAVLAVHLITYWQSVGLLLLARILVGGLGRHGSGYGLGHRQRREAWREYEEWWQEAGKKSFEDFAGSEGKREGG